MPDICVMKVSLKRRVSVNKARRHTRVQCKHARKLFSRNPDTDAKAQDIIEAVTRDLTEGVLKKIIYYKLLPEMHFFFQKR